MEFAGYIEFRRSSDEEVIEQKIIPLQAGSIDDATTELYVKIASMNGQLEDVNGGTWWPAMENPVRAISGNE